jgi:hypothetical protein
MLPLARWYVTSSFPEKLPERSPLALPFAVPKGRACGGYLPSDNRHEANYTRGDFAPRGGL